MDPVQKYSTIFAGCMLTVLPIGMAAGGTKKKKKAKNKNSN